MTNNNSSTISPLDVLRILGAYPLRWIVPTVLMATVAGVFAWLSDPIWTASQAMVVRSEARGEEDRPGKFKHADEMKTTQETVLELARNEAVLKVSLNRVGPPANHSSAVWPSPKDVAKFRDQVKVTPPGGAEFGTTEVFYLNVESTDAERARRLVSAIVDAVQTRFHALLGQRAKAAIGELQQNVGVAQDQLRRATERLTRLEKSVGSDLAELRILNSIPSASSDLRQTVVAAENELRQAQTALREARELLDLLRRARDDESQLVSLPTRLLGSHGELSQLIAGLSAARLKTSTLLGSKSDQHPLVIAAREEEAAVTHSLRAQLESAIRIAETEDRLGRSRIAELQQELTETHGRLQSLASQRAEYANRVAEVESLSTILQKARANVAEARASVSAANSKTLIARIDGPTTGVYPKGPRKSIVILAGAGGGLLVGLGIIFLTVSPSTSPVPATSVQTTPAQTTPPTPAEWQTVREGESVESMTDPDRSLNLKQALSQIV